MRVLPGVFSIHRTADGRLLAVAPDEWAMHGRTFNRIELGADFPKRELTSLPTKRPTHQLRAPPICYESPPRRDTPLHGLGSGADGLWIFEVAGGPASDYLAGHAPL